MKTKLTVMPLIAVVLTALVITSCSGCGTPSGGTVGVNANSGGDITGTATVDLNQHVGVGATGTFNHVSNAWSAGLVITFKTVTRDGAAQQQLAALAVKGQAVSKDSGLAWNLPKPDLADPAVVKAITAALKEGATISSL